MPTNFDSFIYQLVNTTSTSSVVGSHEVIGGSKSKKINSQMTLIEAVFCFDVHMLQNAATSMPSLTSQSCGDSLSAVHLARQVGAI